jgi:hypothetical protein
MFMRKSKQQTLADTVTRNVLKYMTSSGMLFTQKDINNIHMIISKSMRGSFPKQIQPDTNPKQKRNKTSTNNK